MRRELPDSELRLRLDRIARVLRCFGRVDDVGIADLVRRPQLPSREELSRRLKASRGSIPAGVSPDYIADCLITSLQGVSPDTQAWREAYRDLQCRLDSIRAGQRAARQYHDHVFQLLCAIFDGSLTNPQKEEIIDGGRGRIDITFDNTAAEGFFWEIRKRHGVPCDVVPFECKNCSTDLGNTEYNQLSSRLNEDRGMVGFLVCRHNTDSRGVESHCRDRFQHGKGVILVLDDSDVKALLEFRRCGKVGDVTQRLAVKFRALKM